MPGDLEDGAQSEGALRPCSATSEPRSAHKESSWTAVSRGLNVTKIQNPNKLKTLIPNIPKWPDRSHWALSYNSASEFRTFGFGSFDIDWNLGFGHWDLKPYA